MTQARQTFKTVSKRNPLRGVFFAAIAAMGISGLSGCEEYSQNTDQTINFEDAVEQAEVTVPTLQQSMTDTDLESLDAIEEDHGPNYVLRQLTQGERSLLNTMFGHEIDTRDIYLVFYNKNKDERDFAAHISESMSNFLIVLNANLMSEDYSESANAAQFSIFIKLSTHAARYHEGDFWAHSRGHINENFPQDSKQYALFLNEDGTPSENRYFGNRNNGGYGFEHYSVSQQVLMLSDYMLRFAHPSARAPVLADTYGHNSCAAEDQLARVIEDRFRGLKNIRTQNWGHTSRDLSDFELHFAASIFGDDFSFDRLSIHHQKRDCTDVIASVNSPHKIDFWGDDDNISDFATAAEQQTDAAQYDLAVLAHEIVHIWQLRTKYEFTNGRADRLSALYNYAFSADKDFRDYNDEQQGAIIQDYVGAFLTDRGKPYHQGRSSDTLRKLQNLVEHQFPQAKITREYYAQHGTLPPLPEARPTPNTPVAISNSGV